MSPDGKWVASGSADGTLKIWDITADKVLASFEHPGQIVTTLEYNPQNLALANGCSDGTVHYWDLENFKSINVTKPDTGKINHLLFSELNAEHLFASSSQNLRVMNIENNIQLDSIQLPPKEVTDLKISYQRRYLLLSCIQSNTLSVYYQSLDHINFDETVDTIPIHGTEEQRTDKRLKEAQSEDIEMKSDNSPAAVHDTVKKSKSEMRKQQPIEEPQDIKEIKKAKTEMPTLIKKPSEVKSTESQDRASPNFVVSKPGQATSLGQTYISAPRN